MRSRRLEARFGAKDPRQTEYRDQSGSYRVRVRCSVTWELGASTLI